MIRRISLEEDLALKKLVTTPREQKPGYAWRDALGDSLLEIAHPEILVSRSGGEDSCSPARRRIFSTRKTAASSPTSPTPSPPA